MRRKFRNSTEAPHGALGFLKWMTTGKSIPWERSTTPTTTFRPPATVVSGVAVTFVNHATVLLQVDGMNILTDPIWSDRCSPFSFAGPRRYRLPGIAYENLPPIHLVLLSHNHYDHFDWVTVRRLVADHNPQFLMGLGHERLARRAGITRVEMLDWWATTTVAKLPVTFVPAQHFSGRGVFDRDRSLWGGFVMKTSAGTIYFAGDSGYGPHFTEIADRLGAPDLALLPIGAYEPRWFMSHVHMNPDDAVRAHLDLRARQSMAVHFGTFKLSDEGSWDPITDLEKALRHYEVDPAKFWCPRFGEHRLL